MISLWCSHLEIKDNSIKKIMTGPRIKIHEDYGHDKMKKQFSKELHAYIHGEKPKWKRMNQAHFESRCLSRIRFGRHIKAKNHSKWKYSKHLQSRKMSKLDQSWKSSDPRSFKDPQVIKNRNRHSPKFIKIYSMTT